MASPLATTEFEMTPVGVLLRLMSDSTTTDAPERALYRARGAADMYLIGSVMFDCRRRRPLVVVSPHKDLGPLVDVTRVVEIVGDVADTVVISDSSSARILDEALPRSYRTYGGAVRVVAPGVAEDSPREHRPLIEIYPDDPDHHADALTAIEQAVHGVSKPRRRASGDDGDAADSIRLATEKTAHKQTKEQLAATRKQLADTRKALDHARTDADAEDRPVYNDPEAQFAHELYRAWLRDTEEAERQDTWPLRSWVLGPEFLSSVEGQQVASRRQVIRVCVDVITGRHAERAGRKSHKARRSGALAQTREDGAELWRCAVNDQTASAARMHWWKRRDGVIELYYVGVHDDYRTA